MPIYHMMFLHSSNALAKTMIALCRDFLWGYNGLGGRKVPLVAWRTLTQPKVEGGLGLKDFHSHLDALLCQWFNKALDSMNLEWSCLLGENLRMAKWRNE